MIVIARERLGLERRRAHFQAALKEAQSPTAHQENLINAARAKFFGSNASPGKKRSGSLKGDPTAMAEGNKNYLARHRLFLRLFLRPQAVPA